MRLRGGHPTVSTVSIGSNRRYAENWDSIFKGGKKAKKAAAPAKGKTKAMKTTSGKKKVKSSRTAGKAVKRKS